MADFFLPSQNDASPAQRAETVDASSGDDTLTRVSRGLYVGTSGDVAVTMYGGGNVTFANVPAGTILPVRVTVVLNSGTTASDIVALD